MFQLVKWYCDCVSDEGVAFVGYWARMRCGPLGIRYAATLRRPLSGETRDQYTVRRCAAPSIHGDELRWDCRRLGVRAEWTTRAPAVRRTLLETSEGSISWHCHFPCAQAHVSLAGEGRLSGLGYAEELRLSVKPWRLPFDWLRWGRFLSAEDAVTWIELGGREPKQWVLHNGRELPRASIGTDRIELPEAHAAVELRDPVVLRDGQLTSTALRVLPATRVWLPAGIRHAHETKWLARGTFTTSTRSSSGWAIHEVVRLR